jgi:hypothetical protein
VSGNPKGRGLYKSDPDWVIARGHTVVAINKLVEIMNGQVTGPDGKTGKVSPALQLHAAITILERGWGRPAQAVQVTGNQTVSDDEMTEQEALDFIRNSINSIAARIDHEKTAQLIEERAG